MWKSERNVRESLSDERQKKSEIVIWTLGGNKGLWRVNASESETPAALQSNPLPFFFPPTHTTRSKLHKVGLK